MRNVQNSLKKNTIMLYILKLSQYLFPLLTFPYLTRVLQPELFGIVTYANGIMVYFQMLIDFGFLQSATQQCALYSKEEKRLYQIVSSTTYAKLILGFFGLMLLLVLSFGTQLFEGRELYILLAYIPVFLSSFSIDYLFRGIERMEAITYRSITARGIYTILIFILIKTPENYIFIPIIAAIGESIVHGWAWLYALKRMNIKLVRFSFGEVWLTLKGSSLFFLSRIATTAYSSTNILLLGLLYSNALLAQFGVATALINNIRSLVSPLADSLYPYMIRKKNYKLVKKIILFSMPISLAGVIVLFFLSESIILLMAGESYGNAIIIFQWYLPIVFITLPTYLTGYPVLGAMNRMKDANLSVVYAGIFHLVGLVFLYSFNHLSFISVTILTCLTEFFVLIYRVECIRKVLKRKKISANI